jgi:lipopolysaccharide cholinephosphotransferase
MEEYELKLLHNKILEIAEYFDNFCKENEIIYYLMGGTALGAIRHQGFIPWDDDFDVFMDHKNYNKFLNIVYKNLDKEKYYFQKENTREWPMYFSKIRMNGTTFIEKDVKDKDMHHGIYIDIMCLNNTSLNKFIRYLQYFSARVLNTRALIEKGYITNSILKIFSLNVAKIFINGFVRQILLYFVRSFNNKETKLVGHFFGRASFLKTSFPVEYLEEQRYVKFENLKLPVLSNIEGYLKIRYGNKYMELPSKETKMQYPSHAYIVDTDKCYNERINE